MRVAVTLAPLILVGFGCAAFQTEYVRLLKEERAQTEAKIGTSIEKGLADNKAAVLDAVSAVLGTTVSDLKVENQKVVAELKPLAAELAGRALSTLPGTVAKNPTGSGVVQWAVYSVLAGLGAWRVRRDLRKRDSPSILDPPVATAPA